MSTLDMQNRAEMDAKLQTTPLSVEAVREPVHAPESRAVDPSNAEEENTAEEHTEIEKAPRPPIKLLGVELPAGINNQLYSLRDWGTRWRTGAIEKTPGGIVNHSSNVIGAMQFCAELFMFKSSGLDLVDKANQGKPLHYIIDPPKNIFGGVFKKVGVGAHPLQGEFWTNIGKNISKAPELVKDIPKLPETMMGAFSRLNDTKMATLRDRVNTAGEFQKMTNKWSARSSFCGLMGMTIAAVLPDKKDTPEETEKYAIMAKQQPVKYALTRVYQALNPIEWWNHKRQFAGLGMLFAGALSFTSGFRQVAGKEFGKQIYMHNGWQMAGGAITTAGGAQLLLAVDNETGWRNFGITQIARMSTLPASIWTRYKGIKINDEQASWIGLHSKDITQNIQEQGAGHYFAAQGVLQAKNVFAASVGGAEKDKDGNIVDHQKMRKEGFVKAKKIRLEVKLKKAEKTAEQVQVEAEKIRQEELKAKEAAQVKAEDFKPHVVAEEKKEQKDMAAVSDASLAVSLKDAQQAPSTTVDAPRSVELAMPERAVPQHEAAAV